MGVLQSAYRLLLPRRVRRVIQGPERRELRPRSDSSKSVVGSFNGISPIEDLERLTTQFPSMGGKEIGPFLRKLAREAPAETAIVEVGSWLGAGTAQLALGVHEREAPIPIYTYDRWEASGPEVAKALKRGMTEIRPGQDTLPWVMEALRPFNVPITFVKGDISDAAWDGMPISVYIDDAAKTSKKFLRMLRTFGPSWIPGKTLLVLMDYYYWRKTGVDEHRCQTNFIENHRVHFEQIEGFRRGSNAAFVYTRQLDFDALSYSSLKTRSLT
jgi:hypothetical protein